MFVSREAVRPDARLKFPQLRILLSVTSALLQRLELVWLGKIWECEPAITDVGLKPVWGTPSYHPIVIINSDKPTIY